MKFGIPTLYRTLEKLKQRTNSCDKINCTALLNKTDYITNIGPSVNSDEFPKIDTKILHAVIEKII